MLFDDNEPLHKRKKPLPLDNMSVDELNEYIAAMKQEILRVEAEIVRKKAHKDAVSSLFK